jgi:type VI protein secretion system component VasK
VEPVTALVTALAAGAAAAAQNTTAEIVKDAYRGLKKLVAPRLSSLAGLAERPESKEARDLVAKEAMEKHLAEDENVLAQVRELAATLAEHSRENLPPDILLEDIEAIANIRLSDNEGTLLARRMRTEGSFELSGHRIPKA